MDIPGGFTPAAIVTRIQYLWQKLLRGPRNKGNNVECKKSDRKSVSIDGGLLLGAIQGTSVIGAKCGGREPMESLALCIQSVKSRVE
jgi:hypothetical protein